MKIELSAALEQEVASRIVRPVVGRVSAQVERAARDRAPDGKIWVTRHDERVRHSHDHADGQVIPGNLRYKIARVVYVRKGRGPHGRGVNPAGGWHLIPGVYELARVPRDPALTIENRVNCRCRSVDMPGVVAASIHAEPVMVAGPVVSAQVATEFPQAAESEFGTSGDTAARFMRGAIEEVAARYR